MLSRTYLSGSSDDSSSEEEEVVYASNTDDTDYEQPAPAAVVRKIKFSSSHDDAKAEPQVAEPPSANSKGTAAAGKRPVAEEDAECANKSKRRKSVLVEPSSSNKRSSSHARLWSEKDEIALLCGMIQYRADNPDINPDDDKPAYHAYLKQAVLPLNVDNSQLREKIRRMGNKYLNNASGHKVSATEHEKTCFHLSRRFWGIITQGGEQDGKEGGFERNGIPNSTSVSYNQLMRHNDAFASELCPDFLENGMKLLSDVVKEDLDKKWQSFLLKEAKLYLERLTLVGNQIKLILDASGV